MKWSLEERALAISLLAILLLMGSVNLVSQKNAVELAENARQVQVTYDVLRDLTDFFAAMSVAESGRRGYIFSGRTEELSRHQTAVLEMKTELKQLQNRPQINPSQQQQIQRLSELATERITLFQQSIDLYQRDRSPTAMQTQNSITDASVQIREHIQILLTEIENAENQQLQTSLEETRINIRYRSFIERLGTLLGFLVACSVVIIFYWAQRRRQKVQVLEQALIQEQELGYLKLRLFSMISHEFRTPLSVILASSQLLGEILEPKIEQSQLKNLYRIQASAKLMNRLITDILMLTRAEAGKLECKPEWIDIEAFCLNLLDDIQSSNTMQHKLQFASQGKCGRIYLDEKLLYSILSNLLLNSIKYSPSNSEVYFTLKCEASQITFEIQDQGIGILENDVESIFMPFYRGKNVESIGGSGLGLAVVKKCLELQKGDIHFKSRAGKGTKFIVRIPL